MLRTDNEHAISALSIVVCQARTEESILMNSPQYSSASIGATEVAKRTGEGQIRTIRGRLDQVLKIWINMTDPIVPSVFRRASW